MRLIEGPTKRGHASFHILSGHSQLFVKDDASEIEREENRSIDRNFVLLQRRNQIRILINQRVAERRSMIGNHVDLEVEKLSLLPVVFARGDRRFQQLSRMLVRNRSIVVGVNQNAMAVQPGQMAASLETEAIGFQGAMRQTGEPRLPSEKLQK